MKDIESHSRAALARQRAVRLSPLVSEAEEIEKKIILLFGEIRQIEDALPPSEIASQRNPQSARLDKLSLTLSEKFERLQAILAEIEEMGKNSF